jgi:hypothetical protein
VNEVEKFYDAVTTMRQLQREYFKRRELELLEQCQFEVVVRCTPWVSYRQCREAERKVDRMVATRGQKELFPEGISNDRTEVFERLGRQMIEQLSPAELFNLKEQLAKVDVFGLWRQQSAKCGFERPEPGKRDTRVTVWYCDGDSDLERGWYYRLGFGVVGIGGVSNRTPFELAQQCMAAADALLAAQQDVFIVQEKPNE